MKLLFLTDIHFDSVPEKPHYAATNIVHPAFWNWLETLKDTYDLIVCGGDVVVRGPGKRAELEEFKTKMDAIGCPYVVVPGNHDLCPLMGMEKTYPGLEEYEYKPLHETNFAQVFGETGLRNVTYIGGIKMIGFALRNGDPDGQLVWLAKELQEPIPKLVYNHYPVVPARSGGFCATWDYNRIRDSKDALAALLGDSANRVAAYFCGHLHINSAVPLGNTLQIVTGAAGLGLTAYREIEIEQDIIKVSTKRLPSFTDFVGSLMNENRSCDAEHPDMRSYHWGNEAEREIEIALSPLR